MSASKMATQKVEDFEEVALYDPALEVELFGEMNPALEEELFGSSELDVTFTTSSPAASVDTSATSFDSEFFTLAPAPEDKQAKEAEARRLSREEDKRLSLERRNSALNASGWLAKTTTPAQQKYEAGGTNEKSDDEPTTEMPPPSKPDKSTAQRALEEEKQAKLERRNKVLQENGLSHPLVPQTSTATQQKRKRGDEDEAGEKGVKRGVSEAAAKEMRKPSAAAAPTSKPKRKRGADDDDGEKPAKRGLTEAVAAEIAQERQHEFAADLEKVVERRDGVSHTAEKSTAVATTKKMSQGNKAEKQHLVPSSTVIAAGNDDDGDDEMTRMLKEELAKPFDDDESEPEDPIVEEILQPLTESEKLMLARKAAQSLEKGKLPPTAGKLRQMVQMVLKARAKKASSAPTKSSPLANDGTPAEAQEIEARPKLLPKSRKPAPAAASRASSPVSDGGAIAEAQETQQRPKLKPKSRKPAAPATATSAAAAAAHTAPLPPAPKNAGDPAEDYAKLKNAELQKLCRERGLVVGGVKKDLVRRLADYDDEVAAGEAPTGVRPAASKKEKYVRSWMR